MIAHLLFLGGEGISCCLSGSGHFTWDDSSFFALSILSSNVKCQNSLAFAKYENILDNKRFQLFFIIVYICQGFTGYIHVLIEYHNWLCIISHLQVIDLLAVCEKV